MKFGETNNLIFYFVLPFDLICHLVLKFDLIIFDLFHHLAKPISIFIDAFNLFFGPGNVWYNFSELIFYPNSFNIEYLIIVGFLLLNLTVTMFEIGLPETFILRQMESRLIIWFFTKPISFTFFKTALIDDMCFDIFITTKAIKEPILDHASIDILVSSDNTLSI